MFKGIKPYLIKVVLEPDEPTKDFPGETIAIKEIFGEQI